MGGGVWGSVSQGLRWCGWLTWAWDCPQEMCLGSVDKDMLDMGVHLQCFGHDLGAPCAGPSGVAGWGVDGHCFVCRRITGEGSVVSLDALNNNFKCNIAHLSHAIPLAPWCAATSQMEVRVRVSDVQTLPSIGDGGNIEI